MNYPSFFNDVTEDGSRDDLRSSFLNISQNINDISYNRLFQENKMCFFANRERDSVWIHRLLKKPDKSHPFINQYKLIPLPNKNTTTLSNCTNPNTKIKLAVSPMNSFVAIKQFKKGSGSKNGNQTYHNNVSLKVLNSYMNHNENKNGIESKITAEQAQMRIQFDKLAWEYYIYLNITQSAAYKSGQASNIVEFLGVVDSKASNKVWFVFEYCELGETQWEAGYFGEFLSKIWNRCYGFSSTPVFFANYVTIRFLKDCLHGIKFLNDIGITHRDIKPSNILVQRNLNSGFTFKISDFETAIISVDQNFPEIKHLSKSELYKKYQNEVNKLIGSPMFISPEICGFVVPDVDETSNKIELKIDNVCNINLLDPMKFDCWALGVSLYCLLKGQRPFQMDTGSSEFNLYRRINSEDIMAVFRNNDSTQSLYDINCLRKELLSDTIEDVQTKKIAELSNFVLLELCDQLLVKENSKRKLASEFLIIYDAYLSFIEDSLSQLVNKSATNGCFGMSNDNMVNLAKKTPFKIKSNTSLQSSSSYSNSAESLHIITSPSNLAISMNSTGGKLKKLFQRTPTKGNKSPSTWLSKTPEKLEISAPVVQQYLSLEPDALNAPASPKDWINNSLGNGKYIDLANMGSPNAPYQGLSGTDNADSDDGLVSITSSDDSSDFSGSFTNDCLKSEKSMKYSESNSGCSNKLPTPYNYKQLDIGYEASKSSGIKAPTRSPMRQISAGKQEGLESPPQSSSQKRTLTPSMKTMDFKKFLNDDNPVPDKKRNRLTVLNIRDSILNFENIDSLKKYLNFAENGVP